LKEQYFAYKITSEKSLEILQAFLVSLPFEALQEEEDHVIAYVKSTEDLIHSIDDGLNDLKEVISLDYTRNIVPDQNWNAKWESNFEPVIIDGICCIKADFHDIEPITKYTITINPKMAFGTGHHETTYMMIEAMDKLDITEASVFDFGCGTGILAILAEQMGARSIYGIDYDEVAVENAHENMENNQSKLCVFECASSVEIPKENYDVILANINRKVLLDHAEVLSFVLKEEGALLLSGILKDDRELVLERYQANGFVVQDVLERGDWLCVKLSIPQN